MQLVLNQPLIQIYIAVPLGITPYNKKKADEVEKHAKHDHPGGKQPIIKTGTKGGLPYNDKGLRTDRREQQHAVYLPPGFSSKEQEKIPDSSTDKKQPQDYIADYQYLYQRFPVRQPLAKGDAADGGAGNPGTNGKTAKRIGKVCLEKPSLHRIHNVGAGDKEKENKKDLGKRPGKFIVERGKMNNCSVYKNADSHNDRTGTGWRGNVFHKEEPDQQKQTGDQHRPEQLRRSWDRVGYGNPTGGYSANDKNCGAFQAPDIQDLDHWTPWDDESGRRFYFGRHHQKFRVSRADSQFACSIPIFS